MRKGSGREHILKGAYHGNACVAVCCSVLQCVAVCCSVLQCVAVFCSTCVRVNLMTPILVVRTLLRTSTSDSFICLQCVSMRCSVLQCVALCCSVRCSVLHPSTSTLFIYLQCVAVFVHLFAMCCSVRSSDFIVC